MLILLSGGLLIVLNSGCVDPGADQAIPPIERWAAKTSIRAYLKGHTPATKNPLQISEMNLSTGCSLYINNCAVCHGLADGKTTKIAQGFYKSAPQFSKEDWSKDADGLVYWFIEHGVRLTAMPAYNATLSDTEKWQIVMFVKEMGRLPEAVGKKWKSAKSIQITE